MAVARLSVLPLFFVSLVLSQPADDNGVQSAAATTDLSFPWSRLRLPRYLFSAFFYTKYTKMELEKKDPTEALV